MPASARLRRVAVLVGAALIAVVAVAALQATGALDRLERLSFDARHDQRGTRSAGDRAVIVAVDEPTLAELGDRWPYPRRLQAAVLERIAAATPRAIGYDIQLSELTDDANDQAIAAAVMGAGPLVLATGEYDRQLGPNVIFDDADLAAAGVRVGHAGFPDTPDNTFRTVPESVDGLDSFARVVAAVAAGESSGKPFPDPALIDYRGPLGTIPTISFVDVLKGRVAPERLRDRVVIVGTTAARLGDTHPTPFGGAPMSGPEINANAVLTILDGFPLRRAPAVVDWLLLVAVALAGAAAAWTRRPWLGLLPLAGALIGLALMAQLLFAAGVVVNVSAPLLAAVVAALIGVVATHTLLDRERLRLRREFARFVPEPVVDQLTTRAGGTALVAGRRLHCTVLFADLRGFTAAAERLPPETVVAVLNHYLTEMSDEILDAGGTLVSFMGDGVMALFGAPLEQEDHADRAIAVARNLVGVRLSAFNRWYGERTGGEPFRLGVGVASGPVMAGTVGSRRRVEYTAVGDTTNMASRLQALTKETPHAVLIADATRAALRAPVSDLEAVGALPVRGRAVPAAVWTLAPGGGQEQHPAEMV